MRRNLVLLISLALLMVLSESHRWRSIENLDSVDDDWDNEDSDETYDHPRHHKKNHHNRAYRKHHVEHRNHKHEVERENNVEVTSPISEQVAAANEFFLCARENWRKYESHKSKADKLLAKKQALLDHIAELKSKGKSSNAQQKQREVEELERKAVALIQSSDGFKQMSMNCCHQARGAASSLRGLVGQLGSETSKANEVISRISALRMC
eukprot:TRINITY_DN3587_c0_g2_i1.p1 TRINITY_DN3587_c0_g2~~TRINITY_DN3587_c0_g2_i1.p1  ORF type:complete len:210 (-),score=39.81 TRINITY_DN3587_c0_g2_i1:112-741(-)